MTAAVAEKGNATAARKRKDLVFIIPNLTGLTLCDKEKTNHAYFTVITPFMIVQWPGKVQT